MKYSHDRQRHASIFEKERIERGKSPRSPQQEGIEQMMKTETGKMMHTGMATA
jgi:hypothetical protein